MTTYYLGAGASANAIPCVADLGKQILKTAKQLSGYGTRNVTIQMISDSPLSTRHLTFRPDQYLPIVETVCFDLAKELSIDTLAKRYYVQNRHNEYLRLKAVLYASFLVWKRLNGIDNRYSNFWLSLMQPTHNGGSSQIMVGGYGNKMNIISWNYDTQFEDSLIEIYEGRKSGGGYYIGNEPTTRVTDNTGIGYTKLNGSIILQGTCQFMNAGEPKFFEVIPEQWLANLYSEIISNPSSFRYEIESIRFCWEPDPFRKDVLKKLKTELEDTEVLVVIGYTFPTPNHRIDVDLINSMSKLRKVYFQGADKQDAEKIRDYFSAVRNDDRGLSLIPIDSKGFFIPPEATMEARKKERRDLSGLF